MLGNVPLHLVRVLDEAHTHDGRRVGVRGGNRHACERGDKQGNARREARGNALGNLKLDHVHGNRLDDALASYGRAQGDGQRAHDHEPQREAVGARLGRTEGERDTQKGDGHELLAVLGTVQERERHGTHILDGHEEAICAATVGVATRKVDELHEHTAKDEAGS